MDSQYNATSILCARDPGGDTLYEVFTEPEMNIGQCIYPTEYEKLFCLPNTNDTSALEPPLLKTLPDSFEIIRRRIRDYTQLHYDFALLVAPQLTVVSAPLRYEAFQRMRGTPTLLGWGPASRWDMQR
jgi:chromosome partitioning protein